MLDSEAGSSQKWEELRKNRAFIAICIASVIVAAGIFALLIFGYINRYYNDYEIVFETDRQDSNTEKYICQDGQLIKYSKDGISGVSIAGETLWTGSYEMSNPHVALCGDYILVADIGGKDAFLFDKEHKSVELSVDYEIKQADVSSQGLVALMMEDSSSDIINIYDPKDVSSNLLIEIPTNVDDGYPVSMAFSSDGMSVVASYICVTSGKAESRVAFYNFSDVGKNTDCLVGAKNYEGILVTDVHFLSDDTVCLFSDEGFYIWKNPKRPKQVLHKKITAQIKSVFYDEKNVGVILETDDKKTPYQGEIYNLQGKKTAVFRFAYDYNYIELVDKEILFYSSKQCGIFRLNGGLRFHKNVEDGVDYFFKGEKSNQYYLFNSNAFQEIKLINNRRK